MKTIFVAAFLMGLAHAVRGQLQNVLRYSNGEPEIVYDGDLVSSDFKEYNLCHITNCDEEEEIARNKSKQIHTKIEDFDYFPTDDGDVDNAKDYENIYDDDSQDLEMEEEFYDDDIDDLEENHSIHDGLDGQLEFDDYYIHEKPKLYDNNFVDQLSTRDLILD